MQHKNNPRFNACATRQEKLAEYKAQGGYTSSVESEIKHFQTMIRLAEDWLIKNP